MGGSKSAAPSRHQQTSQYLAFCISTFLGLAASSPQCLSLLLWMVGSKSAASSPPHFIPASPQLGPNSQFPAQLRSSSSLHLCMWSEVKECRFSFLCEASFLRYGLPYVTTWIFTSSSFVLSAPQHWQKPKMHPGISLLPFFDSER